MYDFFFVLKAADIRAETTTLYYSLKYSQSKVSIKHNFNHFFVHLIIVPQIYKHIHLLYKIITTVQSHKELVYITTSDIVNHHRVLHSFE